MKKENTIILGLGIGFLSSLGAICILNKIQKKKKKKRKKNNWQNDEHRHFDLPTTNEEFHGVEMDATI